MLKKLILFNLLVFTSGHACFADWNFGILLSLNCDINSLMQYKNNGLIAALTLNINTNKLIGNGAIRCLRAMIDCNQYNYNGSLKGWDCTVVSKKFDGTGTISGKKILIKCDEFNFKGTIDCSQECTIHTKKQIDMDTFKRAGTGKFNIVLNKDQTQ